MSEQTTTGEMSVQGRDHFAAAQAMVRHVNAETAGTWRLDSRLAGGALQGAWRLHDGATVAVLKWHDPSSSAPYNPDAPAIVEYLRAAGYPTPRWLHAGRTADGVAWSVQEFVDGEPVRELDVASAEVFLNLVGLQRDLSLPTVMSWNPYVRSHVFAAHPSHRPLIAAGGDVRKLLDDALALAAPYESSALNESEMVHCDLNVSNILMNDGRLVAVVDIDAAGRGCAVYDLLSPAVNGMSWDSDRTAIERLVHYAVGAYGAAPIAVAVACLVIETTVWYLTADPARIEQRVVRHRSWMRDIRSRLA